MHNKMYKILAYRYNIQTWLAALPPYKSATSNSFLTIEQQIKNLPVMLGQLNYRHSECPYVISVWIRWVNVSFDSSKSRYL